ncbi:MAG: hypothetical protein HYZ53_03780 [Planctomycetes bacterium]|nr:hypothetical protein [Planctomycetota bacterium]
MNRSGERARGRPKALCAFLPILLVSGRNTSRSLAWLGFAGAAVVLGVVGVRLNIVIPAQIAPEFASLPGAYHHPRFAVGYFPSANEWLAGLGVCALGVWGLCAAWALLPLREAEELTLEAEFVRRSPRSRPPWPSPRRSWARRREEDANHASHASHAAETRKNRFADE